ncbi:MAG TPA: transglycosylase SLT domain-containing protein [Polyangiaceae bacterium]|nr:transglycosylase SLT domain-containing protein [Polyangiaceae bacterium]
MILHRPLLAPFALLLGVACSPALPPTQDVGVAPPGTPPAVQAPLATPAPPSVASPAAASEPTPDLAEAPALASFSPLLAEPVLGLAAEAVAREDFATAAAQVASFVSAKGFTGVDEARWLLLLGTLLEKSGDIPSAVQCYERSSQSAWSLTDYAALGRGRCLVGTGELDTARLALERVDPASVVAAPARILLAEIACRQGDTTACLEQLSRFVEGPRKPIGWAAQAFRVVDVLGKELAQPRSQEEAILAQAGTLDLIRSLTKLAPGAAARYDVAKLEQSLLAVLPEPLRRSKSQRAPADRLALAEAMESAGRNADADAVAGALLAELGAAAYGPIACQARLVQGKALNDLKQRDRALARFAEVARNCKADDVRAWALYLAGKYSFQDKRYPESERLFAELEAALPNHRLADDARLYRAQAQLEMGVDGRFGELLERMPDDYPQGDMTLDGVFALALRRMEKGDWSGASTVLARAIGLMGPSDAQRGQESSGRERYFQARASIEMGERERGLTQYEALLAELPLSYYMLHAYSRLREEDGARAERALTAALSRPHGVEFHIEERPEFEQAGFVRAIELLRQGDIDSARREVDALGVLGAEAAPAVLWGVATLYARAGSPRHSHALPRWQMVDWLEQWPSGTWEQAWNLAYPRPHIDSVTREAKRQGIEPALVYAVMREESAFDASAVSAANAYGLMQIISPTARRYGKETGLPFDRRALTTPEISIAIGSRVLASYRQNFFPADPLLTIPGYNAGPGRPIRWAKDWPSVDFDVWVELIPFRETRRYTKRVLASRAAYGFLYYRGGDFDPLRLPRRLNASATVDATAAVDATATVDGNATGPDATATE